MEWYIIHEWNLSCLALRNIIYDKYWYDKEAICKLSNGQYGQ